jgi:hypothetical protein
MQRSERPEEVNASGKKKIENTTKKNISQERQAISDD